MVGVASRIDDGTWKLACRLGFAWRRAKTELFDCELEGIGDVVDAMGLQLVRLGNMLRPDVGLSAEANLKRSRPEVQTAASLLAALAGAGRDEGAGDGAPLTPQPRRRRLGLGVSAPPLPRPGLVRRMVQFDDDVVFVPISARPPKIGEEDSGASVAPAQLDVPETGNVEVVFGALPARPPNVGDEDAVAVATMVSLNAQIAALAAQPAALAGFMQDEFRRLHLHGARSGSRLDLLEARLAALVHPEEMTNAEIMYDMDYDMPG
jgi:hypothetical protein